MQREASFDGCRLEIVCQVVIRSRLPFPHDGGDEPMRSSRHRLREHLSLVEDEFIGRCKSRVRILALLENDDVSVFLGKIDQMVKTRPPFSRPVDNRRRPKFFPRKWKNDTTANVNPFRLFKTYKIRAARRRRYESEGLFLLQQPCQPLANCRNTV